MAPGCFAAQSSKEIGNTNESRHPVKPHPIKFISVMDVDVEIYRTTPSQPPPPPVKTKRSREFKKPLFLLSPVVREQENTSRIYANATTQLGLDHSRSYSHEINLEEIPLPPPPSPTKHHDQNNAGNNLGKKTSKPQSQCLLVASSSSTTTTPKTKKREVSLHSIISDYTVDTFEILEQTIIKQKRVAKLKNTDLRKKVIGLILNIVRGFAIFHLLIYFLGASKTNVRPNLRHNGHRQRE